ncbi:MAG: hypothetical protein CO137_03815 [Candidatus Magasanikbacteria bacterium CG_4_9_14_3_um_filter_32_9]|uniref:Uncharacterized protein n=1 Tax=Candidatus Magasanikbacteria bacterium CG_4_9_14_3_um_filter_32_9 TaxID=1974644 RepID=A0A2M7Z608_9BACT|nr:MAG: hypothetical protein CO137_03815 [Candidatus Magasanikbacteria bacterium CG_4_9_14_3_um_filter_32_9]
MKKIIYLCVSLLAFVFLTACADDQTEVLTETNSEITSVVEFGEPIQASEFFSLISQENKVNPSVRVFIQYGETNSSWAVPSGTQNEQFQWLLDKNIKRFEFLLGNFDPYDSLEGRVHAELLSLLSELENTQDMNITKVEIKEPLLFITEKLKIYSSIMSVYEKETPDIIREETQQIPETTSFIRTSEQALIDWTDDAGHVPVAGTSTFYSDGILHKFWFDSSSKSYYSSTFTLAWLNFNKAPAFEIDTMFTSYQSGNGVVSCGNDSTNQIGNLPNPYVDTELFDGNTWRVCTVGTQNTSNLQTWYLYWTWRSLDNLKINEYPYMRLNLQPGEMCTWCNTLTYYESPANCTCGIGAYGSISNPNNIDGDHWWQWIIEYYYMEGPGVEKSWIRN